MRQTPSKTGLSFVCVGLCFLGGVLAVASALVADDASAQAVAIAEVGDEKLFADEVERELRLAFGDDLSQIDPVLKQRSAQLAVDRLLVMQQLRETKQAASAADVDLAIEQLRNELKAQGVTLQEYLRRGRWREEALRRHLAWTLGWQRFLDQTVTDANLEKYFDRHRPDFDGRQVRVAHVLLKVDPDDSAALEKSLGEAERIRGEIVAKKLSFIDAAKQFSQAPTAEAGGDVGFIRRRGPMPEPFSKAALWLEVGEVSRPVVSPFGVHLIQCLEIQPGTRTWKDAQPELRKAVAEYLFRWAADKQRAKTKVDWLAEEYAAAASSKSASASASAAPDKN